MHQGHEHEAMSPEMVRRHYGLLGLNLLLSGIVMYLVMFTMIWTTQDFFNNLNTFYMTVMMVSPMAILMLLMMGMMYPNRRLNLILYAAFAAAFALAFLGMRDQSLIGDRQFLRSMIPHHSGAILMCREAPIRDAEIRQLCFGPDGIIASQSREIEQMNRILERKSQR